MHATCWRLHEHGAKREHEGGLPFGTTPMELAAKMILIQDCPHDKRLGLFTVSEHQEEDEPMADYDAKELTPAERQ